MFTQVFTFIINSILSVISVMKSFYLDESLHITFYDFLLFILFVSILIRVINFLKQIQEVESEDSKQTNVQYHHILGGRKK